LSRSVAVFGCQSAAGADSTLEIPLPDDSMKLHQTFDIGQICVL
jgi:hypothetical protein